MEKIVDKISEKTLNFIFDYMSKSVKTYKKRDLWVRAVKKACEATEGMDDSFADYILNTSLANYINGVVGTTFLKKMEKF